MSNTDPLVAGLFPGAQWSDVDEDGVQALTIPDDGYSISASDLLSDDLKSIIIESLGQLSHDFLDNAAQLVQYVIILNDEGDFDGRSYTIEWPSNTLSLGLDGIADLGGFSLRIEQYHDLNTFALGGVLALGGSEKSDPVQLAVEIELPARQLRAGLLSGTKLSDIISLFGNYGLSGLDALTIGSAELLADLDSGGWQLHIDIDVEQNLSQNGIGDNWTFELRKVQFDLLYAAEVVSGAIRGQADMTVMELDFNLDVEYCWGVDTTGWRFIGQATTTSTIGQIVESHVGQSEANALPEFVRNLTIADLGISIDTVTSQYTFSGRITTDVTISDPGKSYALSASLNLVVDKSSSPAVLGGFFAGTLTVNSSEFYVRFDFEPGAKLLTGGWTNLDGGNGGLAELGADHGLDLSVLTELLLPDEINIAIDLVEKSLNLNAHIPGLGDVAFMVAKPDAQWVAGFGIRVEQAVTTGSLPAVGDALAPHNLALTDLVIVAASADAQQGPLGDSVRKGLLLQGELGFEETSFSFPFECRLGGEQGKATPEEKAADAPSVGADTTTATPEDTPTEGTASEGGTNNVAVGRTIGPVTFRKARLESRDQRVYLLLDASLGSGGFALELVGFNVNFPLTLLQDPIAHAADIAVGLEGLGIAYSKPPLTISGGFAVTDSVEPYVGDLYQGELLIKAETFQVTVLGSYGNILINDEKKPSLFLYGTYAGVLGGPAAFYVTGLALGGGYNTRLAIPPVEEVAEFPLVQAVTDPEAFATGGIDRLRTVVQPSYGDYWLAVGVKFDSFKMADSFALFTVNFGHRLQFALLGLTKLALPTGAEEGEAAVYAELAIRAVLDPEAGVFCIEGRLTDASYVLSKQFHLTGGFAFFLWFGNASEAGDFVISLGGYHPDFLPPPHYPVVPRVAIHGQLSKSLTVTGEAYLAITPSCLMAGQKLEAVFTSGDLTATFVAYADFLIAWAPFHYDAKIGIGIAVRYQLNFLGVSRTFKLEASAKLHVWGPPFAGTAEVSVSVVSFTVAFGDASGAQPKPLGWDEFRKAFLPSSASPAAELRAMPTTGALMSATEPDEVTYLNTIRITEGLVREVKQGELTFRIVNPHELMIETDSVAPCSEVVVGATTRTVGAPIGLRPMGATALTSRHDVDIIDGRGTLVTGRFNLIKLSYKNFPEALWSKTPASGKPEAGMVKDVPSGVVLRVMPQEPVHRLGPFLTEKFKYEPIDKQIPWLPLSSPAVSSETFSGVSEESPLRSQIRDCLVKHVAAPGKAGWNAIAMTNTSNNPSGHFQAPPTCAVLGERF